MVLRLRDSRDSKVHETPRLPTPLRNTLAKNCQLLGYAGRCVLCDFIFKKRRNSNVQASRFVLTIRLGRFEVKFPYISKMNPFFN